MDPINAAKVQAWALEAIISELADISRWLSMLIAVAGTEVRSLDPKGRRDRSNRSELSQIQKTLEKAKTLPSWAVAALLGRV